MRVLHVVVGGVVGVSATGLLPASCAPPPLALPCSATVSSPSPPQRSIELVTVLTSPAAAVAVTTDVAAGPRSQAGRASAVGRLVVAVPVGTEPVGRRVAVTVHVALGGRDARCATSFVPVPGPPRVAPAPLFGPVRTLPGTGTPPDLSVVVGDVSGDGRADVVAADPAPDGTTPGKVFVYRQGPGGLLLAPYTLPSDAAYAGDPRLAIADVTGDGAPDLLLTTGGQLDLYPQRAGRLTGPVRLPVDAYDVHVADLDRDGFPDLLVVWLDQVRLYRGNARHTFAAYSVVGPAPLGSRTIMALGDVNGDGRQDIVVDTLHGFWVSSQDASGHFGTPRERLLPPDPGRGGALPFTAGLAVGDVSGDGRADVVASNGENAPGRVLVYLQHDGALAAVRIYGSSDIPAYLAVVDANGDGRKDLAVYHAAYNTVDVYDQDLAGGLGYENPYALSTFEFNPQGFALADVTSDGRPDLVGVGAGPDGTAVVVRDQLPPAP